MGVRAGRGEAALIRRRLAEAVRVKKDLARACARDLERAVEAAIAAFRAGRRIYFLGNGGSAADAQHMAAELEGRFRRDRPPLAAAALTTNTSTLTAVANDYGYEQVFKRQVEAHVRKGDMLIAISTSGNSPNVLRAAEAARKRGACVVALTGAGGGALRARADICLRAPSKDTARIQECHATLLHVLCEAVESALFPPDEDR